MNAWIFRHLCLAGCLALCLQEIKDFQEDNQHDTQQCMNISVATKDLIYSIGTRLGKKIIRLVIYE